MGVASHLAESRSVLSPEVQEQDLRRCDRLYGVSHHNPAPAAKILVVKMAIVVRADLGMGRGKAAAQAAHAAVAATLTAMGSPRLQAWLADGQPKVVLRVDSQAGLDDVVAAAHAAHLAVETVADAGRTQLTPGTVTCAAIGPAEDDDLDAVTGALRLY
jgi:PTH2 family peptidyl-tRNA hydrolase